MAWSLREKAASRKETSEKAEARLCRGYRVGVGGLYTIPRNVEFILKVAGSHERNVNGDNYTFKSLFCSGNDEKD